MFLCVMQTCGYESDLYILHANWHNLDGICIRQNDVNAAKSFGCYYIYIYIYVWISSIYSLNFSMQLTIPILICKIYITSYKISRNIYELIGYDLINENSDLFAEKWQQVWSNTCFVCNIYCNNIINIFQGSFFIQNANFYLKVCRCCYASI